MLTNSGQEKKDLLHSAREPKDPCQLTSVVMSRQDIERVTQEFNERTTNSSQISLNESVSEDWRNNVEPRMSETVFCQEVLNTVKTLGVHTIEKPRESDSGVSSAQSTGTVPWGQEGDDSIVL